MSAVSYRINFRAGSLCVCRVYQVWRNATTICQDHPYPLSEQPQTWMHASQDARTPATQSSSAKQVGVRRNLRVWSRKGTRQFASEELFLQLRECCRHDGVLLRRLLHTPHTRVRMPRDHTTTGLRGCSERWGFGVKTEDNALLHTRLWQPIALQVYASSTLRFLGPLMNPVTLKNQQHRTGGTNLESWGCTSDYLFPWRIIYGFWKIAEVDFGVSLGDKPSSDVWNFLPYQRKSNSGYDSRCFITVL